MEMGRSDSPIGSDAGNVRGLARSSSPAGFLRDQACFIVTSSRSTLNKTPITIRLKPALN